MLGNEYLAVIDNANYPAQRDLLFYDDQVLQLISLKGDFRRHTLVSLNKNEIHPIPFRLGWPYGWGTLSYMKCASIPMFNSDSGCMLLKAEAEVLPPNAQEVLHKEALYTFQVNKKIPIDDLMCDPAKLLSSDVSRPTVIDT